MRSYKVELDPTDKQRTAFLKHAGAARWAYNYGLARKIEAHKARSSTPSAMDLNREIVVLKKSSSHAWLSDVSKCAPQQALRNLDTAYRNFYRRCKSKAKVKGFPKFKSRKNGIGSFYLQDPDTYDRVIRLPKIGRVRMKERGYVPVGKAMSAVVSERAGRWFVSVYMREPEPIREPGDKVLGIDVGINHLATLSDGTKFENPRAATSASRRMRIVQKAVSRKAKWSANRKKAVAKLARLHYRIACVRKDAIHKATSAIIKRAAVVGIESLNVDGMLRNHSISGAVRDAGMSEFLRQLEYKAKWAGVTVVKADRFYPSSKTCSACGLVKGTLGLSERTFKCECGFVADRDVNAAINLRDMAGSSPASACRPGGSGPLRRTKPLVGQEPNGDGDVA